MKTEDLLRPVDPDQPCGPDLLAEDDDAFLDYYFNVEDRLPTAYFNIARNELFDPRSIDWRAETASLDALLNRSRDIRLIVIEAKFQILAGRFRAFAAAVGAIAALLETWPEAVHPTDATDRRNAIEELDTSATVVQPLEYAALFTDRRAGDILYRAYATGTGKLAVRPGEAAGNAALVQQALSAADNTEAVDALHGQLVDLAGALNRISAACKSGTDPFTPRLDKLTARLQDMIEMVRTARPDLVPGGAAPTGGEGPGGAAAGDAPAAGTAAGGAFAAAGLPAAAPLAAVVIADHRAAAAVLDQAGRYFARFEPAALSAVLVTQARLLIGRPLVEAIDVLMENNADRAVLTLGTDGFQLRMSRLRNLSGQTGSTALAEDDPTPLPELPDFVAREQVAEALKAVEDFLRMREPASPVPILLFKARNLLGKDFHALVRELLP
ncbi:type VI secretion system protein TssA [Frigidibacter oleivorans]|uniref:type VI secretion system protein TssA n=1 Tax=Frigidibacter oleivorans TaxID=2487129 RepID=UPI0013E067D6|nr:type VI secretion system ImpA family N-terminal domain-containing protein [Frigidibacter oleivorans]